MTDSSLPIHHVAVIGAGPAGLFAARTLADAGVHVSLFNRDVKPGGLAEYGIFHDKETMKNGLRKQFRKIMEDQRIAYYGNVTVGEGGDVRLSELKSFGFDAVLVTVGAQGTKWLGMPGEELEGVYHAKDLVYHYNQLPPFSEGDYRIGKRVALVGAGNVMLDIAHWTIRDLKVDNVTAVVRRGPAEIKFTPKEFELVCGNLAMNKLKEEVERCRPIMEAVGQDPEQALAVILKPLDKALEPVSETRFLFDFLASPTRILGDGTGRVAGLEVEDTTLIAKGDDTKAVGLGTTRVLDVDTVVFCIGDTVDGQFGLPLKWSEFAKRPEPRFPQEGLSYEAFDPEGVLALDHVFLAGWAREASSGLVGAARKDGTNGAKAVLEFLTTVPSSANGHFADLQTRLDGLDHPVITTELWTELDRIEAETAVQRGLSSFKFGTNEEMFAALGVGEKVVV